MNTLLYLAKITVSSPLPKTSDNFVTNALYVVFGALGGISLIMVTWAGMKYTLSGGDASKTAEAKNQIMYAIIGIAVAISASSIVAVISSKL